MLGGGAISSLLGLSLELVLGVFPDARKRIEAAAKARYQDLLGASAADGPLLSEGKREELKAARLENAPYDQFYVHSTFHTSHARNHKTRTPVYIYELMEYMPMDLAHFAKLNMWTGREFVPFNLLPKIFLKECI